MEEEGLLPVEPAADRLKVANLPLRVREAITENVLAPRTGHGLHGELENLYLYKTPLNNDLTVNIFSFCLWIWISQRCFACVDRGGS